MNLTDFERGQRSPDEFFDTRREDAEECEQRRQAVAEMVEQYGTAAALGRAIGVRGHYVAQLARGDRMVSNNMLKRLDKADTADTLEP